MQTSSNILSKRSRNLGYGICAIVMAIGLIGCGRSSGSVSSRGPSSQLAVHKVTSVEHLDYGAVTLAPPAQRKAFTTAIRSRIEGNQAVSSLLTKGYSASVEYVDYTSNKYGTSIAGMDPSKAAAIHPTDSERRVLEANADKIRPVFNKTPTWFVIFDGIPGSAIPEYIHPGAAPGKSTTTSGPDSGGTVAIVFDDDAEAQVQLLTFPKDSGSAEISARHPG